MLAEGINPDNRCAHILFSAVCTVASSNFHLNQRVLILANGG